MSEAVDKTREIIGLFCKQIESLLGCFEKQTDVINEYNSVLDETREMVVELGGFWCLRCGTAFSDMSEWAYGSDDGDDSVCKKCEGERNTEGTAMTLATRAEGIRSRAQRDLRPPLGTLRDYSKGLD